MTNKTTSEERAATLRKLRRYSGTSALICYVIGLSMLLLHATSSGADTAAASVAASAFLAAGLFLTWFALVCADDLKKLNKAAKTAEKQEPTPTTTP